MYKTTICANFETMSFLLPFSSPSLQIAASTWSRFTECYLGPLWGIHFYWMLFGTILGNPFLLNFIWGHSEESISKNQNMDYSGETIFKKTISGTILGKPFQRTKRWTILGKPFLKTNIWDHSGSNFQPHYHTQAPVVRQNLEAFLGIKSSDLGLQSCHLLVVLHNSASIDF